MRFCGRIFRCHQLSERSFFYKNMQFPLCARCTGLLLGFFPGGPLLCFFVSPGVIVTFFLFFVLFLDGFLQLKGIFPSTNLRRLLTGLGAGYGLFSLLYLGIEKLIGVF